jgi:tetratricopeptide (TPR) repeat protein
MNESTLRSMGQAHPLHMSRSGVDGHTGAANREGGAGNVRRLCVMAALLLGLGGCATLAPHAVEMEQQVEEVAEPGEYGRALAALDRQIERDPDNVALQSQRADLRRRADRFEQTILIEAAAHLRVEDWAAARERYEHGLALLPDSEALQAAHQAFETERQQHVRALRTRLLLARAHSLIRERPMYEELHRISPGNARAHEQYQRAEREARELAEELRDLGEAALDADDPLLAVEALTLAHALSPVQGGADRLDEAESARQARLVMLQVQPIAERDANETWTAQDQALLERYHNAFRSGDLALARHLLEDLSRRHPDNEEIYRQRPVLSRAIDTHVSAGLERGLRLYTHGRIEEALDIWRPLRALAPENRELEAHVERAERVQRRLEALQ